MMEEMQLPQSALGVAEYYTLSPGTGRLCVDIQDEHVQRHRTFGAQGAGD